MDAIVLSKSGDQDTFLLQAVDKPAPQKGQVLVRIIAAAFNPFDVKVRKRGPSKEHGSILGVDFSGVIEAIGEGVSSLSIGEAVYGWSFATGSNGSYAQYVCVPIQFVYPKPKQLSFEEAASVPLVAMTAYRATSLLKNMEPQGSIFVAGAAGGVGGFALQFIRHFYSDAIFTVAGSEKTQAFLEKQLGVHQEHITRYKDQTTEALAEKLIMLNGGSRFFASFDFVGGSMKELCIELTGFLGHFVTIVPEETQVPWAKRNRCFQYSISVHPTTIASEAYLGAEKDWGIYSKSLAHITKLIEAGQVKVPSYEVVGELSAQTVETAHALLESRRGRGKLVMQVSTPD